MKLLFNTVLAISCISIASLTAGCKASADNEADEEISSFEGDIEAQSVAPEASCYVGVWVESSDKCACPLPGTPGYTLECQAEDCTESQVLALDDQNAALRIKVRYSAGEGRLTAVGKATQGQWKSDGSELYLSFDGVESSGPAKCSAGALAPVGQSAAERASKPLATAVTWAWQINHWLDVPYQP